MDRLETVLRSFYKYFSSYPAKWRDVLQDYSECSTALCNEIEQLQLIKSVGDKKLKILEIPLLKQNLLGKIYAAIETEVQLLNKLVKDCSSLNQELQDKCDTVRRACDEVETVPLQGSPTVPSAALLIEWIEDVSRYYHTLYLQLSSPLNQLSYEDPNYMSLLKEAAKEDPNLKEHIERIMAYTQYMIMEN
ncbi:uncharacterized protein C1orf109 homolog [Schistocerca americana]|uniref:uncharacterized protein C1orf109 homolog n=1 Tax=Schistocerca americana TaxID=7009 RepID=UPI001F4FD1A8|nr:uncharacterized protein C1orf109 homolog [Schistocerca americana]XP_049956520.1 uncharacterized protein C1orf109 homolog isoform X1 [Schistocerca serialis cubense]